HGRNRRACKCGERDRNRHACFSHSSQAKRTMNSKNSLSISLPEVFSGDSIASMSISVSIVEDNPGTRTHLAALLKSEPKLRLLNAYPSGEDAVRGIVPGNKPDVVVVDIKLPGMSGIECVIKLKAAMPDLRVLILTTYQESDLIFNCLRAGANGYL